MVYSMLNHNSSADIIPIIINVLFVMLVKYIHIACNSKNVYNIDKATAHHNIL